MRAQQSLTFAAEVCRGLTNPIQKRLPTRALYDEVGSALFDAITALPEYGLTRADVRLLTTFAPAIAAATEPNEIIELGSGSGAKTRLLLSAFPREVVYRPVDVSAAALERCRSELSGFDVRPVQAEFLAGLEEAVAGRNGGSVLVIFLGSNIGNFERPDIVPFLQKIRTRLEPGDTFLLGADLIKPVDQLLLAYDDPAGVTAAFNRNLLSRLNREMGADFNVRCFDHEARWNADERRIEMHLRARSNQIVTVGNLHLKVPVAAGETIWTESSHKFRVEELVSLAAQAGFARRGEWVDPEWPFVELLLEAVSL